MRIGRWPGPLLVQAFIGLLLLTGACSGGDTPTAPATGTSARATLRITAEATGNGDDADGFTVNLGSRSFPILSGDTVTVGDLEEGPVTLRLGGLAHHCAADPDTAVVQVPSSGTVTAEFQVACYGRLIYEHGAEVQTDLKYLDRWGSAHQVVAPVDGDYPTMNWAPDGTHLVLWRFQDSEYDIFVADMDGNLTELGRGAGFLDMNPTWSPDGQWIAYTQASTAVDGSKSHVHLVRPDGSDDHVVIDGDRVDLSPAWSPDGAWIAVACWLLPRHHICLMRPDGSEVRDAPTTVPMIDPQNLSWSPDGTRIAFEDFGSGHQAIRLLRLDTWEVTEAIPGKVTFGDPEWSPDGKRLAVAAADSDRSWTDVVNVDDGTATALIDNRYWSADWSPDGKEIAYGRGRTTIDIVDADNGHQRTLYADTAKWVSHARWRPSSGALSTPGASPVSPHFGPFPVPSSSPSPSRAAPCQITVERDASGLPWVRCAPGG